MLNENQNNLVVVNTKNFSLINYQKAFTSLKILLFILNNLVIQNKKIVLSNFKIDDQANFVDSTIAGLATHPFKTLTKWYPGVLTNLNALERNTDLMKLNFEPVLKPHVLINFGKLISPILFSEVEKTGLIFLSTINTSDPVTKAGYYVPINTTPFRASFFVYCFFVQTINRAVRSIQHISYNRFLRLKYKLYLNFFLLKKNVSSTKRFIKIFVTKMRNRQKIFTALLSRLRKLRLSKKKKIKYCGVTKFLGMSFKQQNSKLKKSRKQFCFHHRYYQYYYKPSRYAKYQFFYPHTSRTFIKRNVSNKRLRFLKLLTKKKTNEYKVALRFAKTKAKNRRFYIPWYYFRYIKNKERSLSIKFTQYIKFKKKKSRFARFFTNDKYNTTFFEQERYHEGNDAQIRKEVEYSRIISKTYKGASKLRKRAEIRTFKKHRENKALLERKK
jgi:hypothetical protein